MQVLESRFGTLAVKAEIVTLTQLQEALGRQVEENVSGEPHRLIGTILQELGYITSAEVARILLLLRND